MGLSFLNDLAPWVDLAGQIFGRNQANKAVTKNNVATRAEIESNALYRAMLDPNSPQMRALTEQNRAQNLSDFQQQLNQMQMADRRATSLGRAPTFFNPERADESLSYLTSRGLPQLNALAQQQAMSQMGNTAAGIRGTMAAQQGRLDTRMQQGVSNASYNSGIPSRIVDILSSLGGQSQMTPFLNGSNMTRQPVPGQYNTMIWDK